MPELPEVETIKLGLQKYLVGHVIDRVDLRLPRIVYGDIKNIEGAKVIGVRRFGKGLVIDLSNKNSIAVHIKLTGQFIYRGPNLKTKVKLSRKVGENIPNKWTHVIFYLDQNGFLYYNDLRQFGWIKIIETSKLNDLSFFRDMGPEPPVAANSAKASMAKKAMEGQAHLTLDLFKNIVGTSNTAIKPFIMDQKKIGGIGNIYANDALFDSGIDPRRKAKSLSEEEIKKLYESILKVLKLSLKIGGASELNFVNVLGEEGHYQDHSLIYGRVGQKCKRCGRRPEGSARRGTIKKIFLGGRGTFYCPACQK